MGGKPCICPLAHYRRATAADSEILTWANERGIILITNELDFSLILPAARVATPSVVQIQLRTCFLTPS
jgi:predicted nuclease of predicted toxin-antitoxin system